jgi:hypothetical protein
MKFDHQLLSQELNKLEKENKSKDKRIAELEKENDELFLKLESVEMARSLARRKAQRGDLGSLYYV